MGDADDYEIFFEYQYPKVVALLIAYHRFTPAIAEEATAEAMTRLLGNWDRVRKPRAWVRTVAVREAARLAKGQEHALPDGELVDERASEDLAAVELALIAGVAIKALPPRQQEVMALALVDMKPAEMASVLGCTAEQARSNLAHARRTLRNAIRTEEEA